MNSFIFDINLWWISSSASARVSLKMERPCSRAMCVESCDVPVTKIIIIEMHLRQFSFSDLNVIFFKYVAISLVLTCDVRDVEFEMDIGLFKVVSVDVNLEWRLKSFIFPTLVFQSGVHLIIWEHWKHVSKVQTLEIALNIKLYLFNLRM